MHRKCTGKSQFRHICALVFCISSIFIGTVFCGNDYVPPNYNQQISSSSGECPGQNMAALPGEKTLALAALVGPNITICILRTSDGTLLRHYDLAVHGPIMGSGNGLLYVEKHDGTDGSATALCAIQIDSGFTRWCQEKVANSLGVSVADGRVYAFSKETQTVLTTLSESDGRVLWTTPIEAANATATNTSIAFGLETVYINIKLPATPSSTNSQKIRNVCALRATTGLKLWCQVIPQPYFNGMVASADALYVLTSMMPAATQPEIFAYNFDGTELWHTVLPQLYPATSLGHFFMAQGKIFLDSLDPTSNTHLLTLVNPTDGSLVWSHSYSGRISSVLAGAKLYTTSETGTIDALNPNDGKTLWSLPAPFPLLGYPLVSPFAHPILDSQDVVSLLISGSQNGYDAATLLTVRTRDGKILWKDEACNHPASTPTESAGENNGGTHCYWKSQNAPTFSDYRDYQAGYTHIQLLQLGNA